MAPSPTTADESNGMAQLAGRPDAARIGGVRPSGDSARSEGGALDRSVSGDGVMVMWIDDRLALDLLEKGRGRGDREEGKGEVVLAGRLLSTS